MDEGGWVEVWEGVWDVDNAVVVERMKAAMEAKEINSNERM